MEIDQLKKALASKILPKATTDGKTKLAAVLVIIYGSEPTIVMTERPKTMNQHAGEISFPGGTWKEDDNDLLETALRETEEEIGLRVSRDQVIGQLRPVTTLNSGYTITPFVSLMNKVPKLTPNSEIEKILHIPMLPLLETLENDIDPAHKLIQEMYIFTYQNKIVWGASARMLKQMVNILSKNQLI